MKIENRTFIVSGGRSGLGLATVQELLSCKAHVALLDLSPPAPEARLELELGKRVKFIKTDVTSIQQIENAVNETVAWTKETGARLGGLVNCAGIAIGHEFFISPKGIRHSVEVFEKILKINTAGTFHLSCFVAERLAKTEPEETKDKERGVIIMVASEAAFDGQPSQSAYAASKGAIHSLTLPMARDLSRHNIRVVSIAPGPFTTPMTDQMTEPVMKAIKRRGLLYPRRFGEGYEFAKTVRWAVECGYVNGETVRLNGGGRVPAFL